MVLAEEIVALIWHRHPALIWINSAEWEVLRSSLAFGQHIKKCGFPEVDRVIDASFSHDMLILQISNNNVQSVYIKPKLTQH